MGSRSVFLDRDGTINREVHHLRHVSQLELLDGAAQAIRLLEQHGFKVVIVTNQAAIGRGILTEDGLLRIHEELHRILSIEDAHVDAIYYCPHHPTEASEPWRVNCDCRKPKPGSLVRAADDMNINLEESWMVGDKISDLEAGFAAGCRSVLVRTGYGKEAEEACRCRKQQPNHIADNLLEAAEWIVQQIS